MKKNALLLAAAPVFGVLAFCLRLLHVRSGFEPDTGLPIPGHPLTLALPAVLAAAAAVLLVLSLKLPADKGSPSFTDCFQGRGALAPTLMICGAFLWLLGGGLEILGALSYGLVLPGGLVLSSDGMFSPKLSILSGVLMLLAGAALVPVAAVCRTGGRRADRQEERRPLNDTLTLVPVGALVLRLVLVYREDSVNPSLSAYYLELLALSALILALYRASSFAFGSGRTRRFAVYAAWAVMLCLATLADGHTLPNLLIYLGGTAVSAGLLAMRLDALGREPHTEAQE